MKSPEQGFSTVEMLIAIFVGAVFIFMGYQLYDTITKSNQSSSEMSIASTVAKSALQKYAHNESLYNVYTCANLAGSPAPGPNPFNISLQFDRQAAGETVPVTVTCPDASGLPNLRKASATATYKGVSSTHVIYYNRSEI